MLEIVEIGKFEFQVARSVVMSTGNLSQDILSISGPKDEITIDHASRRTSTS